MCKPHPSGSESQTANTGQNHLQKLHHVQHRESTGGVCRSPASCPQGPCCLMGAEGQGEARAQDTSTREGEAWGLFAWGSRVVFWRGDTSVESGKRTRADQEKDPCFRKWGQHVSQCEAETVPSSSHAELPLLFQGA